MDTFLLADADADKEQYFLPNPFPSVHIFLINLYMIYLYLYSIIVISYFSKKARDFKFYTLKRRKKLISTQNHICSFY